ncbi:MAG: DNA (cytosine-5-)-methyltransferase, partial [Lactobacillus amylovorus]|nr:DNA (cytosine-5-)-methyltransferase [Lactobacillus amylovorus]
MNNKKEFVSSLTLPKEEVSRVLNRKIKEERENVKNNRNEEAILFEKELFKNENNLFQTNVINTVSLFSGAGGLDLGVELAGISTEYGVNRAYEAIKNQEEFYKLRGLVNIIY